MKISTKRTVVDNARLRVSKSKTGEHRHKLGTAGLYIKVYACYEAIERRQALRLPILNRPLKRQLGHRISLIRFLFS